MAIEIHNDEQGMTAALAQSARGRGRTSPRPSVGCVLVQHGVVIGSGHTQPGDGNPHAEVGALRMAQAAGRETRGATAYVTLEPCSHFGTTPPCTDALIEAGITRVVAGVRDPNPLIDGRGYARLRQAGIEVREGFMEHECAAAQDHFLVHIATGLPFVTLKSAVSLDGKIATSSGASQWITGPAARHQAHLMRAEHDAVLVGANTVRHDNPLLNVRIAAPAGELPYRQPARIVLDGQGALADNAAALRLLQQNSGGPVIFAVAATITAAHRTLLESAGATVLLCEASEGRIHLAQLLPHLPAHGIFSVLIEGGAAVAASALRAKAVDKIAFFIAPLIIGGDGLNAVAALQTAKLGDALRLRDVRSRSIGTDILIEGYTRPLPGTHDYVHRTG